MCDREGSGICRDECGDGDGDGGWAMADVDGRERSDEVWSGLVRVGREGSNPARWRRIRGKLTAGVIFVTGRFGLQVAEVFVRDAVG